MIGSDYVASKITVISALKSTFLALFLMLSGGAFGADSSATQTPFWKDANRLLQTETFEARRAQRFLMVSLREPHRVLSTSYINGGEQLQLRYLVNHQSMEARADAQQMQNVLGRSRQQYHDQVARTLQLDGEAMALMGTAANMQQLGHAVKTFADLRVDAFVTAGVKGNAMRAGDPARWHQTVDGNRRTDYQGTINLLLLINRPLSPGAQTKAVILATEAKSAALAELAVPSVRSPHLATGTGTDQITLASPLNTEAFLRTSASGHLKLGELIGASVRQATLEALRAQNRLTAESSIDLFYVLGRFGLTRERLQQQWQKQLSPAQYALAENNLRAIVTDPRLVSSAYAFASLLDRHQYRDLSDMMAADALRDQAAQAAVALSGKPQQWLEFWRALPVEHDPIGQYIYAMGLGWGLKWHNTMPEAQKPLGVSKG